MGATHALSVAPGRDRHSPGPGAAARDGGGCARLKASVEYAFAHPDASRDYVASLAQEMDPDVTARHIQLYVNDYTRALDERAVQRMLDWGRGGRRVPPGRDCSVFPG